MRWNEERAAPRPALLAAENGMLKSFHAQMVGSPAASPQWQCNVGWVGGWFSVGGSQREWFSGSVVVAQFSGWFSGRWWWASSHVSPIPPLPERLPWLAPPVE